MTARPPTPRVLTGVRAGLACLRAEQFPPAADPTASPLSALLKTSGFPVAPLPFWPTVSRDRWLQASVTMGGIEIIYRHPFPDLVLVSSIRRIPDAAESLRPVIDGLLRFFLHSAHPDAGITAVLSTIDPDDPSGRYPEEHARRFFEEIVGVMEKVPFHGRIWYVGDPRDERRSYGGRLWRRIAATPAERACIP